MRKYIDWLLLGAVIALSASLMIYQGWQKADYHLDEQWSYGFANSVDRTFIGDHLFYQPIQPELFKRYVTVQADEQFNYQTVYDNNAQDVHPPLFYHLLHTISSLFPDTFSKWHGISLNIICHILLLFALFFLSEFLLQSRKQALFVTILWGFSLGAINMVVFVRMYTLLALFTVLYVLSALMFFETRRRVSLFGVLLTVFLGGLTHYYFFIFAFFLSALICLGLLIRQRWVDLLAYSLVTLAGVGSVLGVYPPMWQQVTQGYRGTEALDGLKTLAVDLNPLTAIFNVMVETFTGLSVSVSSLIVLIVIGLGVGLWFKMRPKIQAMSYILAGALGLSMYLIASIAPDMRVYQDRYFFSLLPLVTILIVAWCGRLVQASGHRTVYGAVCLMTIALIHSSLIAQSPYLFRDNADFNRLIDDHHVIFVMEESYRIHEFASRYPHFTDIFPLYARDHEGVSYPNRILDYFSIFPIEHVRLVLVVEKSKSYLLETQEFLTTFSERGYRLQAVDPDAHTTYHVYRIVLFDG